MDLLTLDLPEIGKGEKKSVEEKGKRFNFVPTTITIEQTGLEPRWKRLISGFVGLKERYDGDRSRALHGAIHALIDDGQDDNSIASILTNRKYAMSETAFDRRPESREAAAKWIYLSIRKARHQNDQEVAEKQTKPGILKLEFEKFEDITFESDSVGLIEELIDKQASAILVGESNTGKTFAALDLAFHVARGLPWFGRSVAQSAILYIAAEGGGGIRKRIAAYKKENGLEDTSIPFRLAYGTIDLRSAETDCEALIKEIKITAKMFKVPMGLVVVDTLNRALAGGDENTSSDMGAFVRNIDRIRQESEVAVLVVHHTGKDTTRGARGHSSLKGAVDTELTLVAYEEGKGRRYAIKATKQRDYDYGKALTFKLKEVALGKSATGKITTSCVVQPSIFSTIKLNPNAKKAVETLKGIVEPSFLSLPKGWATETEVATLSEWRESLKQYYQGSKRRQSSSEAFKKVCAELVKAKIIEIVGEYVRFLNSECPNLSESGVSAERSPVSEMSVSP